jgi:16S rRNA (cytosine967-C5)-methyltransferase
MTGRGLVLGLAREAGQEALFSGEGHAPQPAGVGGGGALAAGDEALDLPDWLVPANCARVWVRTLSAVAEALRQRAPVFLRVNLAKGSREGAMAALADDGIGTRSRIRLRPRWK